MRITNLFPSPHTRPGLEKKERPAKNQGEHIFDQHRAASAKCERVRTLEGDVYVLLPAVSLAFSPPSFDVGRSADHRANRWLCLTACPVCSQCTTPDSALSPDQYARNDPNDGALVEKRHEQTGGKRAARWAIWWEGSERPLEYFISPCTTLKGMPMQDGSVTRFCDRSFPAFPLNR